MNLVTSMFEYMGLELNLWKYLLLKNTWTSWLTICGLFSTDRIVNWWGSWDWIFFQGVCKIWPNDGESSLGYRAREICTKQTWRVTSVGRPTLMSGKWKKKHRSHVDSVCKHVLRMCWQTRDARGSRACLFVCYFQVKNNVSSFFVQNTICQNFTMCAKHCFKCFCFLNSKQCVKTLQNILFQNFGYTMKFVSNGFRATSNAIAKTSIIRRIGCHQAMDLVEEFLELTRTTCQSSYLYSCSSDMCCTVASWHKQ